MDEVAEVLREAREARARNDWPHAFALFTAAREVTPLTAEDLAALSDAAWWLGHVDVCLDAGEAAFRGFLDADRPRLAARIGFELAVTAFLRGDDALGSGWLRRVQRLLEPLPEGTEHGYVRYVLEVEAALDGGDLEGVVTAARDVRRIGHEHGDRNLVALGVLGEGRAMTRIGEVAAGSRLLDESMVAVLHEDLAPAWAGNIYCHLMAACHELGDVERARAWTDATSAWLAELPAAVLFTGICRVHRSQVLQASGEWDRAEEEAARVLADLADLHVASVAEAHYQLGELRRLQGDVTGAEDAYERARARGRDPQPGHALLCLSLGRREAAAAAIRTALLAVPADRLTRAHLCGAAVEIALVGGDLETARRACAELEEAAARYATSGLEATALHWRGALALAEGHPEAALPVLRASCRRWHGVHAPYEAARSRLLLGRTYLALDDHDTAASELRMARATFERLGATADTRETDLLLGARSFPNQLTAREVEVLALVASGNSNREIAAALVISDKTVARHLSNIFTKLDVTSRTAAAAFAFEHGLVGARRGSFDPSSPRQDARPARRRSPTPSVGSRDTTTEGEA
jgi:ATP/maltotriose-dependent transcriptional regulator MalT